MQTPKPSPKKRPGIFIESPSPFKKRSMLGVSKLTRPLGREPSDILWSDKVSRSVESSGAEQIKLGLRQMKRYDAPAGDPERIDRIGIDMFALQHYLRDSTQGWIRRDDHGFIQDDIEVYDLKPGTPTHDNIERLVVISYLSSVGVHRTRSYDHSLLVTPSAWAKTLSTTLGAKPFILLSREAKEPDRVRYRGAFRLESTQIPLSPQDWESVSITERQSVRAFYDRIRGDQDATMASESAEQLSDNLFRDSLGYYLRCDGYSVIFANHLKAYDATVLRKPDQFGAGQRNSRRPVGSASRPPLSRRSAALNKSARSPLSKDVPRKA